MLKHGGIYWSIVVGVAFFRSGTVCMQYIVQFCHTAWRHLRKFTRVCYVLLGP